MMYKIKKKKDETMKMAKGGRPMYKHGGKHRAMYKKGGMYKNGEMPQAKPN